MDISEIGRALAAQNDNVEKLLFQNAEMKTRMLEIEQKGGRNYGGAIGGEGGIVEMADMIIKSDQLASFIKGSTTSCQITVPRMMFKTAILNSTGTGQPLVPPDYRPGIVYAPQRKLTIRDLFSVFTTTSNLVDFCRELVYTSNAGPQGGPTSPIGNGEGELKPESAITFELAQVPVVTIAHWIPASRQVLSDAPALQNHLDQRLLYGLKLKEELALLTGDGTVGEINGMINNASAFTGGATNQTALDTLAIAMAQLTASEFTPTGIILNPADWFSSSIILAKTSYGEYIFGDPGEATEPSLWGLQVCLTNSMTKGKFLVLDGPRTGYVVDREDATVRVAEQHADFFVRNMVAILAEERLALIIEQGSAMVYGTLSNAG